jgi:hypothetical protein
MADLTYILADGNRERRSIGGKSRGRSPPEEQDNLEVVTKTQLERIH